MQEANPLEHAVALFFGEFTIGNIDDRTDKAEKFSALTYSRQTRVDNPAKGAVVPAQAVFHA